MRRLILPLLLIVPIGHAFLAQEPPPLEERLKVNSCVECHSEFDGELLEPVERLKDDIHYLNGLSCHDCHGGDPSAGLDGDPDAAHSAASGWIRPTRSQIPEFCAKCHSNASYMKSFDPHTRVDQLSEYRTSQHGKSLIKGNTDVAVCVDCHGVHGIRAVSDPRSSVYPMNVADTCARCHNNNELMGRYLVPTGQVAEYRSSVHFRALYDRGDTFAPTCNDCHGSHGAVPPGVDNVMHVCGSCHSRESTLFRETEEKNDLNLSACIQCMVCHSNHAVLEPTDEMIGVGPRSSCTGCHPEGEPLYEVVGGMGEAIASLVGRLDQANELLDRAERAGMEVGPDRFAMQKGQDSLVEARVLAHSFDEERFLGVTSEGLAAANAGVEAGRRAFADLRFRRTGLAMSLIVIIAVIVALSLKIRQMERRT